MGKGGWSRACSSQLINSPTCFNRVVKVAEAESDVTLKSLVGSKTSFSGGRCVTKNRINEGARLEWKLMNSRARMTECERCMRVRLTSHQCSFADSRVRRQTKYSGLDTKHILNLQKEPLDDNLSCLLIVYRRHLLAMETASYP